ncbi:MAG TPA: glycerol-3-phosphate dehydrogenase/oxidase [Mycobacteriales bacterium]|nr:glycerol-3-phosphate dehydrogenase/oxidase [Mycobacteriales bacterium]
MTASGSAGRLDPDRRRHDLGRLASERFDLVVVGGGVTGCGAALDAASRGLSVALVEARDWAAGTSSRSSKLIHGGLRYLEQRDFGLVREALAERGLLLGRLAPHLVRPVPIVLPVPHHWQRAYYGAGVALYDLLAGLVGVGSAGRGLPRHRHLSRRGAVAEFGSLRADALAGAIKYWDGQVDDARYTLTLARTAAAYGAAAVSSARVTRLLRSGERVVGVVARDLESGTEIEVRARCVAAATGVWSDDVGTMLGGPAGTGSGGLRVRASKGIHLVVPRGRLRGGAGLILRTPSSVLFVLPWGRHWIIGTTDTDWALDRAHPAASSRDIRYLLDQVNQVLAEPLRTADIEGVYAGLRPLLSGESDATSALSREHAVVAPAPGLVLIAGGKYTTYRVMAADLVDAAVRAAGLDWAPASRTRWLPLLGARGFDRLWADRASLARRHGLPVGRVEHLLHRYGTLATEVLALIDERPALAAPLAGAPDYLTVEAWYAAAAEGALHLDDILTRRTRVSVQTAHRGVSSAAGVAELVAPVLGWDAAAVRREVAHYRARVEAERESQRMPDDRTADAARLGAPDVRGTGRDPVSESVSLG